MGKVWVPRTEWGDRLIAQLLSFPAGKHDDAVDVCGLFGRLLDQTYGPGKLQSPLSDAADEPTDDYVDQESDNDWMTF